MAFQCRHCKVEFVYQYELIMHRKSHSNVFDKENKRNTVCVCQLCKAVCVNEDHLKNHVAQHVQEQKYVCGQCKTNFKTENRYIHHILNYPEDCEANKTCSLCSKTFSYKRNLLNHTKLHTRETLFACATCNKPFILKDKLIIHERIHTKEFHCTFCQEEFKIKKSLNRHRRAFHNTMNTFECSQCPKKYSKQCNLQLHIRSHTFDLPHACKYCDQKFWRLDHKQQHENIHKYNVSTKRLVCLVYDGHFDMDLLKLHMVTHPGGINKFTCKKCEKSFSKKGNLIFHERSHN